MVVSGSCGQSSVVGSVQGLTKEKENSVRQRLREWTWDAEDKAGKKRQGLDVTSCFAMLLVWILSWWDPKERSLLLAMDATTLGERYVVLAISVLYRQCAIPIAWKIFAAKAQSEWKVEWLELFSYFEGIIPENWSVLVLADRGLYAKWLFEAIQKLKWHPFLRINSGGKFCLPDSSQFLPLSTLTHRNCNWAGQAICFKTNPLHCTLLVCWDDGYKDPWLIVTDLSPDTANILCYGARAWIECGFRQTKRAGWQWHQTRMTDPHRASRHWLAIAVATLWLVSVGAQQDDPEFRDLPIPALPSDSAHPPRRKSRPASLSFFRRGLLAIRVAFICNDPLPLGSFLPRYVLFF